MNDVLKISFTPSSSYFISPSKEIQEHGDKLKGIQDLGKQLQYYNEHICSLSYSLYEGLHTYGNYDHFSGCGQLFFKLKSDPNNDSDFEIYLHERQKEIDRLKKLIDNQNSYTEKLKGYIEGKTGQLRFNELKVVSNDYERFMGNGGGTVPFHLLGNNNVINLEPVSPDERKDYNCYLYGHVEQVISDPVQFHKLIEKPYDGFISSEGKKAFELQKSKALNKEAAIATKIKEVESLFRGGAVPNYIDLLYPYDISNVTEWQTVLFNAFVNGYEYDFSRKVLSVDDMKAYYHVEQIFDFYKYLLNPQKSISIDNASVDDLLSFFEASGQPVRATKIAFNKDGTQKVIEWNIGKTIDEKYQEKVEQIEKVVSDFKTRCYSHLSDGELRLLKLNLNEMTTYYQDENIVFSDNPTWQEKINEQFAKAAERLIAYRKIVNEKIEYRENKARYSQQEKPVETNPVESNFKFGLTYIKVELHEYLPTIEAKMNAKLEQWKQGYNKIECAAFCELLYDKSYFVTGSTRMKTLNTFALSRYGNNILVQLQASKKEDRATHKAKLLKFFK